MSTFHCIFASTRARQILQLIRGEKVEKTYPISTSKFGLGPEAGSNKTPLGRFVVSAKIGAGAVPGAVFKSREATGENAPQGGEEDLVLTRILWLAGLEEANANTRERYIYIHGTNQEAHARDTGQSPGCVRMRNTESKNVSSRLLKALLLRLLRRDFYSRQ